MNKGKIGLLAETVNENGKTNYEKTQASGFEQFNLCKPI